MFIDNKVGPPGCNPLRNEDRMPVLKVISGDTWVVDAGLVAADGGPASPKNSRVEFVLAENQFSPPICTLEWMSGIVPDKNIPGLVHVRIPRDVTKTLRRGSYMFSIRVSDPMRFVYNTQLKGNFLVEYMPTSDQHSIPYRDGTSDIFNVDPDDFKQKFVTEDGTIMVLNEETGLYHRVVVVTTDNGDANLGVYKDGKKL